MESGEYLERADCCWEERRRPETGERCAEGHGEGNTVSSNSHSTQVVVLINTSSPRFRRLCPTPLLNEPERMSQKERVTHI